MDKSEIAERAEDGKFASDFVDVFGGFPQDQAIAMLVRRQHEIRKPVERAIAESQAPTNRVTYEPIKWSADGVSTGTDYRIFIDSIYFVRVSEEKIAKRICEWGNRFAELGDGEPSPPPAKFVLLCDCNYCPFCGDYVGECLGKCDGAKSYWRSGAAQEVSPHPVITVSHGAPPGIGPGPPATGTSSDPRTGYLKQEEVSPPRPEPICPMCCKPVFTDRAEGDTRELKAALKRLTENFFPKVCTHDAEPDYCDCCRHEWEIELRKRKAEAEKLLG